MRDLFDKEFQKEMGWEYPSEEYLFNGNRDNLDLISKRSRISHLLCNLIWC